MTAVRKLLRNFLPVLLVPIIVEILSSILFYGDLTSCLDAAVILWGNNGFNSPFPVLHYLFSHILLFVISMGLIKSMYWECHDSPEKAAKAHGVIFILAFVFSLAQVLLGLIEGINPYVWLDAVILMGMAAIKLRIRKFVPSRVWILSILIPLVYQLIMRFILLKGQSDQFFVAHYTDSVFGFLPFFLIPIGEENKKNGLQSCLKDTWAMIRRTEFPLHVDLRRFSFGEKPTEADIRIRRVTWLLLSLNLSIFFVAWAGFFSGGFACQFGLFGYPKEFNYETLTYMYPEGYPGFPLMQLITVLAEWSPRFFIPAFLFHVIGREGAKEQRIVSITDICNLILAGMAVFLGLISLCLPHSNRAPMPIFAFLGVGIAILLTMMYIVIRKACCSKMPTDEVYDRGVIFHRIFCILFPFAFAIAQNAVLEATRYDVYSEEMLNIIVWGISLFLAIVPYILIPLYEDTEYPRLKKGVEQIRGLWRKLSAKTEKFWNSVKKYLGENWKVILAAGIGVVIAVLLAVGIGQLFSGNGGKEAPPIDGKPSPAITEKENSGRVTPAPDGGIDPVTRKCSQCGGDKKCRYCLTHGSGVCDECWGRGEIDCTCFAGDCTACLGDGKVVVGSKTISCTGCGGSGKHKNCGGTGKLDCYHCDGKGDCFACEGTGICPICD